MKIAATTKPRVRQRKRTMFDERPTPNVGYAAGSVFSIGRWTFDVSFIYFS
jgi:hypothetical protein